MSEHFDEHFDESERRVRSASRAQVRANRRNAKRSTGPRTTAGKCRAARNAATHGVFAKDAVLPGERTSEYVAFRNLLLMSPGLRPQTWLELSLADQFVLARWKIRRLLSTEAFEHIRIADDLAEIASMNRADFQRVMELRENYLLMKEANDREEDEEEDEEEQEKQEQRRQERLDRAHALNQLFAKMNQQRRVPPTTTLARSLSAAPGAEHAGVFERIDRLQHRLELSAHRALRELRQLRKDLGVDVKALEGCPFVEDVPEDQEDEAPEQIDHVEEQDDDRRGMVSSVTMSCSNSNAQNEQNEPNSRKTRAGDDASEGCEQGSRRIEPLEHTKLTPRGANPTRDDEREARDRT